MKKYRFTRIKVKTREIIRLSKDAAENFEAPVCPLCHTPFAFALSDAEKLTAVRSSADDPDDRKLKGDF